MKRIIISILLIFNFASFVKAAKVDTISIFSNSMQKEMKCVVVKPDQYKKRKMHFPVVYLLHGYTGDYSNWIKKVPGIMKYADDYNMIIICPDGGKAGWYFDSPLDSMMRYEAYIAIEVPTYIDSAYRTLTDRRHRAITGLSMGGHGALYIAWRHAEKFSATGSMSGAVDLPETKNKYEITKLLGDTVNYAENWKKYSVLNLVETKPFDNLHIIIDDGIEDNFIEGNRKLHQKLLRLKIPHEYTERPGKHNWDYWKYAVHFQLLFFHKLFSSAAIIK
jgi:S-formylglutathione hydrolase FrmB